MLEGFEEAYEEEFPENEYKRFKAFDKMGF